MLHQSTKSIPFVQHRGKMQSINCSYWVIKHLLLSREGKNEFGKINSHKKTLQWLIPPHVLNKNDCLLYRTASRRTEMREGVANTTITG